MELLYDVAKQRGSSRWFPYRTDTAKVPAGPLGTKKEALHAAASLMGIDYNEYMKMRRKQECA